MPAAPDITIRRALVTDIPGIHAVITEAAELGLMLHRSREELYEHVRDFHVAAVNTPPTPGHAAKRLGPDQETTDQPIADQPTTDQVVGVCGLKVVWAHLAEVYALAVHPDQRGQGLGHRLVEHCLQDAEQLQVRTVMSLTYERPFFEKLGFVLCDRHELPQKVWSECVRCLKNQNCDEIAMKRIMENIVPPTDSTSRGGELNPPIASKSSAPMPIPVTVSATAPRPVVEGPMDEPVE